MNGFSVYQNIQKTKKAVNYKAEDFSLKLLGAPNKTVDDILISPSRDKNNEEIYTRAKPLFVLREQIFKRLVNKGIIKSDSDQSGIDNYEKTIAEKAKLRRQRFNEIANEEHKGINSDLFKKYFKYQSPSNMCKELDGTKNTETNQIRVNSIKETLSKLQQTIDYVPKDKAYKTEENRKIINIVEHILEFNELNQ